MTRAVVDFRPHLPSGIGTIVNVKGITAIDIKLIDDKTEVLARDVADPLHSDGIVAGGVVARHTPIVAQSKG